MSAPAVMRPPAINLARRPFRNNTLYYSIFGACAALLAAASAYNAYDFVRTGEQLRLHESSLAEHTARHRQLSDQVEQMKRTIGSMDLSTLDAKSSFANGLILSRLFSWSLLFDRIEDLIPPDVKLRSVRPSISPRMIEIQIDGLARNPDVLYEFEAALADSNFFASVYPVSESTRESKTEINFDLAMTYIPAGKVPAPQPVVTAESTGPAAGPAAAEGFAAEGIAAEGIAAEGIAAETSEPDHDEPAASTEGTTATAAAATVAPAPGPAPRPPAPAPAAPPAQGATRGAARPALPAGGIQASEDPKRTPAHLLTNGEFLAQFNEETLLRARGRLKPKTPSGQDPALSNADFISKHGMSVFLRERGGLARADMVAAAPGAPAGASSPAAAGLEKTP